MTLDTKALEAALVAANDAANDDDTDHKAIMEAAILAYLANAPVSEEMVSAMCKSLWPWAFVTPQAIPPSQRLINDFRDAARSALHAARKAGMGEG